MKTAMESRAKSNFSKVVSSSPVLQVSPFFTDKME